MKFKPKNSSATAASQAKSAASSGDAARKFAVPSIPRPAGLGGKPSRPSVGSTAVPGTPASGASRAAASTSPTSPTIPLRPSHSTNAPPTSDDRPQLHQPSASPAPPTLAPGPASTGVPRLAAAERTRSTPTPSPAPVSRAASRAGSQGRRSTTPSARINGKLALLAAAENANVPLHIPASMDRKKRKLAAEAAKGSLVDRDVTGRTDGAVEKQGVPPAPRGTGAVGVSPALAAQTTADEGVSATADGPTAGTSDEAAAAEHDDASIEAIANRAIAELMRSATASRASTMTPVGSVPISAPVSRAGSTTIDGETGTPAQVDIPAEFMQANKRKTKGMGMKKSRKRKVAEVDDAEGAEDDEGEGTTNGPGKKPRKAAANARKGKGKGEVNEQGEEVNDEDDEGEGDDVEMGEGSQAGSTAKGRGKTRKSEREALQRKKRESMFPRPNLTDSQPGDMIGSAIDEDVLTMSDLATVRSGEGRISRKSQKWQDKASELAKARRSELDDRTLQFWAARRPQRRFIRRRMNEMRATRRAEVAARGGNGDEEVSADEEDSEFELEEDQVRARRMSPEKTPDVDGSEERARRVAEEDRRARGGKGKGQGEGGEDGEDGGVGEDGDEQEGEGEGDEGEGEDDENMEAFNINGRWIRVPRGETPEGEFSYTLRRIGHVEAVRRDDPELHAGGGKGAGEGGEEGADADIWGNFNASGYDEDNMDLLAEQMRAEREGVVDYGDEDDPDRVVVEVEESNAFINSASWSEKTQGKGEKWDKDQTDALYYYLSIFGENFSEMENFFPERTHRQIKLKARREQRNNRAKYEAFFKNRRQPDADELEQITSWRSSSRTRAATKLLEETLLAPGILAKEDAEMRRKRKRKGGKREHGLDHEHGAASAKRSLDAVREEGEGQGDAVLGHADGDGLDGGKEDEEYEEGEDGEEGEEYGDEDGHGHEYGEGGDVQEPLFLPDDGGQDDGNWFGF